MDMLSEKTRTPYQVCSGAAIPASVAVSADSRSARTRRPSLFVYVGDSKASSAPAQSPAIPGRRASASAFRTRSESSPPGASILASPASMASGSSTYISTP